jgi:hypothetical protein
MSTISAGTATGTALVSTGDTTGQLVLQTNGTTTAVTIGTDQVVTLAQALPAGSGGTGRTSLTANNVLLGNGTSAVNFVAPGTNGNVLTSNGTTWTSAAASSDFVLVSNVTGSGVSLVDITGIDSTYKVYKLYISGSFSGSEAIQLRFYINGSLVTLAAYSGTWFSQNSVGSAFTSSTGSGVTATPYTISGKQNEYELTIFTPSGTTNRNAIYFVQTASFDEGPAIAMGFFAYQGTASPRNITGIRAIGGTGTWSARLYGLKG